MNEKQRMTIQAALDARLNTWHQRALGLGIARVVYAPGARLGIEAETKDAVALVYAFAPGRARAAVDHEVLHAEIAQSAAPLVTMINQLVSMVNADVYARQEKLVEKIREAMTND